MNIRLQLGKWREMEAGTLVLLSWVKEVQRDPALREATEGWSDEVYESGEFGGDLGDIAILHRPKGCKARRLVLAGAGKPGKFGAVELRRAVGSAVRSLKNKGLRDLTLFLDAERAMPDAAQAAVEAAILGDYEPDQLKTDPKKSEKRLDAFTVAAENTDLLQDALDRGRILAEAQNFARDLVNEPSNRLPPLEMAKRAQAMADEVGLECEVLHEDRLREIGMGALLGVSQGSDNPPAFIVLRYAPADVASEDHLALVGKGVTFDTGGVSIKPAEGMEKMKYDMGGGAAVLGAMRAIAQLKPGVRITAFVPTVENMVSGRAQRPGDVVTTLAGKTVEVLNTDAEGRLILIDALTYAIRQGCTHFVDAATLTGAIVVALGHVHIGGFTNSEELLARVQQAGRKAGDRIWQMPLDDDYKDYLKSTFADLPNIGGRWGGAITAAKFLEAFVEDKPWVHLDIAGTAWLDEGKAHMAKGPTGVPVRTFVNLALDWAG